MADSVARRPHTATSVRGLISPPSPILVVWLPFTVFLSSPPRTCLHLLIPAILLFPASIFPRPVSSLFSARSCVSPAWLIPLWLYLLLPPPPPFFLLCPLLSHFPQPESLLHSSCVRLKLLIPPLNLFLCPCTLLPLCLCPPCCWAAAVCLFGARWLRCVI